MNCTRANMNCTRANINCTRANINCTRAKMNCTRANINCTRANINYTRANMNCTPANINCMRANKPAHPLCTTGLAVSLTNAAPLLVGSLHVCVRRQLHGSHPLVASDAAIDVRRHIPRKGPSPVMAREAIIARCRAMLEDRNVRHLS